MGTTAAPRIDDRLRRFIAGSSSTESPAAITRMAGDLAWQLGLPRPSYQQVRVHVRTLPRRRPERPSIQTSAGRIVVWTLDTLYQYPGPGMADWYERYKHGGR